MSSSRSRLGVRARQTIVRVIVAARTHEILKLLLGHYCPKLVARQIRATVEARSSTPDWHDDELVGLRAYLTGFTSPRRRSIIGCVQRIQLAMAEHVGLLRVRDVIAGQHREALRALSHLEMAHGSLKKGLCYRAECINFIIYGETSNTTLTIPRLASHDLVSAIRTGRLDRLYKPGHLLKEFRDRTPSHFPTRNQTESILQASISGKRIALVGNGAVQAPTQDLEDFDVIVRTNVFGPEWLSDEDPFSGRTDIVYTNSEWFGQFAKRELAIQRMHRWLGPDGVVVLRPPSIEISPIRTVVISQSVRLITGTPTIGVRAVLHLLTFDPKSLDLFNFDFYLSPSRSRSRFQTEQQNENVRRTATFSTDPLAGTAAAVYFDVSRHDLFSNREVIGMLLASGLIRCDSRCREALALTNTAYAQQLAVALGPWRVTPESSLRG